MGKNTYKVMLCAPPNCSCPEVVFKKKTEECYITDDDQNTVRLTFEEIRLLWKNFVEVTVK